MIWEVFVTLRTGDRPRTRKAILSPGKEAVVQRDRGFKDFGAVANKEVCEVDDMANISADRVWRRMRLLKMDDPVTKTLDDVAIIIQYRPRPATAGHFDARSLPGRRGERNGHGR